MEGKCLRSVGNGLVQRISRAEAAYNVGNSDSVGLARAVPTGRSFFGYCTVTIRDLLKILQTRNCSTEENDHLISSIEEL